ncbi:MAG TPA: FG-GAP-like repeat-containing protein [Terriglobales bacterium]|jgi:tetratricopeptide (TPR) repeat protein|nr:FG-GAP-like repeat-containing protein [Terriglobales bacterium]
MTRQTVITLSGLVLAVTAIFAAAPESPKAADAARLNTIGEAYMNQQLFEKGLKSFQEAATLDPKMLIIQLNQGVAYLNLGKVDEAKKLLEDVVKQDAKNPHAWYNLGLLYKNSSDSQAAVDAFRRVTEIDANDADTWYFLGSAHSQIKQYPQAIEAFQHALKLNAAHASAEFGLSRAYQQSGDVANARQHLQRFQYITQNKLGSPISLAYGEQGKYSRVEESPGVVQKALPAIPVTFVASSALTGKATGSSSDLASFLGPGACFLDYDGDGKPDVFLADNGPEGGMALYHNLGGGKFEDVSKRAGIDSSVHALGCTAGDYDNDGSTDLAVSAKSKIFLLHNEKNGTFKDVAKAAGIDSADNLGLAFIDYDHDGDVDLYVTTFAELQAPQPGGAILLPAEEISVPNLMFRNNGNGTFTDVTKSVGLGGNGNHVAALGSDYNNDRAIDLIVTGTGPQQIFENPREGKFPEKKLANSSQGVGMAVLDFDHDGWMDIAATNWVSPGLTLWKNKAGKSFEPVTLPSTGWRQGYGVAAFDYDNDGWVDIIAAGETSAGKSEVRLFRNLGPDGFKDVTSEVGLDKIPWKAARSITTADYDGDGATDLLITQNHGPAVLLHNQGGNKNNWLRLSLKGLNDNKSAIGTKVEVFAGGSRQKWEIAGSSGYLGQNSTDIIVGLGQNKDADVVRMLWPTGVLQDEIQVAGMKQHEFMEMDRRGSSCPTLFAWNGKHYELIADVLGAGVVGHWVAPGEKNIPRPTEYLKVDGTAIQNKDGKLSFRLMEPMEEVVYLDQVKLLAVDHPAKMDVYPNEYFASNPPYPKFKVVTSTMPRVPAGVWDDHRHNLLPQLLKHKYVGDFELLPFKGFTKLHSLEIDLNSPYNGGSLWLLMHGEIEYFTATGMYAANQAGVQAIAPYVEALDAKGKWNRVIDDMGFPAGGPRTMTADLSDKLPKGTQRIRIWTNLQIYWDNILIDRSPQNQKVTMTPVPLASADLGFHGYPKQTEAKPPGVVKYVYENVSKTGPYARQSGTYTRYGDVLPLLTSTDDQLTIFGSGEQVALEFDPASLPALPTGWKRDYFFVSNGYEKDMDFYAAEGATVEPLPFRQMGTYPYPKEKQFPLDESHLNYFLNYNTRQVSGDEPQGYRFDYPERK